MNKKELLLWSCLLVSGNLFAQQWPSVRTEMRPATRWWWMGSAVDKDNLKWTLDEYARAGMGGVEITPIYGVQGNDKNDIPFLSPKWMQMLSYTQEEGKRVGIETDMNTGTGWPFGGPNVSVEDAATKAVFQTYEATGGKTLRLDISIEDKKQQKVARLSRVMAYSEDGKRIFNLTSRVSGNTLVWNKAPQGKWKFIVLYIGKTEQKVKRAAPGGEGFVMDHLSKTAVKNYLSGFDKAFSENHTPYPHTFFNDSYEVYQADWTQDFLEQFSKRMGYKLEYYFPQFLDKERTDVTRRVVSDYRETISQLLLENFTVQWTDWAHRHGSITRNQAHGSPANLIDIYAAVDIPEIEGFGLSDFHIKGLRKDSLTRKNDSDFSMLKYASSGAHLMGKPYASSETFTWLTEHFRTSLSQCKPDMDLFFVSGVNHAFFHGTAYSPKNDPWPGWKFYASVDMSPTNSIWRDAPYFFKYITRCQSFLQTGRPDNDFLIYLPVYDMWNDQPGRLLMFSIHQMPKLAPEFIKAVNKITDSGYDGDYISDNILRKTRFDGGQLITPGKTGYKAIVIPDARLMPTDVLSHLLALARQGATVVFLENYPQDVPGLGKLASRRQQYNRIARLLPQVSFEESRVTPYGKGAIITGRDYAQTLAKCSYPSEEMKTKFGLQYIRRVNDEGYHYFISSLQPKGVDGWVTLGVQAQAAVLFDPMTGHYGKAQVRQVGEQSQVYLQLKSGESIILQTFNELKLKLKVAPWTYVREQPVSLQLDHGWTLHFAESQPDIEGTFNIDTPCSWTELKDSLARQNMGTGVYSVDVTLPAIKADDWILDLGDVRESARVRINGQDAGCAWAVPFRLRVGKFLKKGKNHIEVEVTNLPANRIAALDRKGVKWRKFKETNMVNLHYKKSFYGDWEAMPSGLNSIVRLIPVTTLFKQ